MLSSISLSFPFLWPEVVENFRNRCQLLDGVMAVDAKSDSSKVQMNSSSTCESYCVNRDIPHFNSRTGIWIKQLHINHASDYFDKGGSLFSCFDFQKRMPH